MLTLCNEKDNSLIDLVITNTGSAKTRIGYTYHAKAGPPSTLAIWPAAEERAATQKASREEQAGVENGQRRTGRAKAPGALVGVSRDAAKATAGAAGRLRIPKGPKRQMP